MSTAGRRLWRTADGGLVDDGDPTAIALAYGPGDELSAADAALVADDQPAAKRGARPADKSRRPGADK